LFLKRERERERERERLDKMSHLYMLPGHLFTEHILTFVEPCTLLHLAATNRTLRAMSESDSLWATLYKNQGKGKANSDCSEGPLEIFQHSVVDDATLNTLAKEEIQKLCITQVVSADTYDDRFNMLRLLKERRLCMPCALHGKWKASYYWRARYMSTTPTATDEELCGSNFLLVFKINPRQMHFSVRFHLDGRFDFMDVPPGLVGLVTGPVFTSWRRLADVLFVLFLLSRE